MSVAGDPPQIFAPASGLLGRSNTDQLPDALRINREASRHYSGCHFSNLATVYKGTNSEPPIANPTPPVLEMKVGENASGGDIVKEAWTENHLRNELLPFIFGHLNQTYLIFSMSEWNGYWWLKPKEGWTYPYSHTIGAQCKWWHDWHAGPETEHFEDVDNIRIGLEEAAKWSGRRVVIGTGRGDDILLLNDLYRKEIGTLVPHAGSLSAADGVGSYVQLSTTGPVFQELQVGMLVSLDSGLGAGVITQFVAANLVGIQITKSFQSTNLPAGKWRIVDLDNITNGTRLDFADGVDRRPDILNVQVTATGDCFYPDPPPGQSTDRSPHVNQVIYNRFGPGKARIVSVTNPRLAEVQIEESWISPGANPNVLVPYAAAPHHWSLTGIVPLIDAMSMQDRLNKAAAETLDMISLAHAHFGVFPALDGFYLAHEPDHLSTAARFIRMICIEGATYKGVYRRPLRDIRKADGSAFSFWVSPASPIDVQTVDAAIKTGEALAGSGLTHLHPQDTTGAGADIMTGQLRWAQGTNTNISQLPGMAYRMQIVAARAGCVLAMHNELWEMAGPTYANPYPAEISRVKRQFDAYGNRGALAIAYQVVGYISQSSWSIKPREAQAGRNDPPDFQARATALADGLVDMVLNPPIPKHSPPAGPPSTP